MHREETFRLIRLNSFNGIQEKEKFSSYIKLNIMPVVKLNIRVKLGEVTSFGSFVLASAVTDLSAFTDYSPKFTPAYMTQMETDKKAIELLVNPIQLTSELKVITGRIYTNQDLLTTEVSLLEGYVKMGADMTVGAKDFGIQAVRKANNSGDIEGVVSALAILNKNASDNMAILTPLGFKPAKLTGLKAIMNTLNTDNTAQNSKINLRSKLVEDNHTIINTFWSNMTNICDIGKRIQKPVSEAKYKEYVVTNVVARMRNDAKKTKMSGLTEPYARIELKPLVGGRKRVIYAKKDGSYEQTGITPNEYMATMYAKGKPAISKNVIIESGVPVVEDFGMMR